MAKTKEFTLIKDLHKINGEVPNVYFDTFGSTIPRTYHNQNKGIRPFIIFYSNGYYYYLICRSAKNHLGQTRVKFDSEVLMHGSKNSNVVPEYDSYIRTNQIFKISENDLSKIVDKDWETIPIKDWPKHIYSNLEIWVDPDEEKEEKQQEDNKQSSKSSTNKSNNKKDNKNIKR